MTQAIKAVTAAILLSMLFAPLPLSPVLAQSGWDGAQLIEGHDDWATAPQVVMDGMNAVAVWAQSSNCVSNYSIDGGVTWEGTQTISAGTSSSCDMPQVAMSGPGVAAVWREVVSGVTRISANYSTDGGATWGTAAVISDSFAAGTSAHVAISGEVVIATWAANDATDWLICCNRSEDGGATWEGTQLIASGAGTTGNTSDEYPRVSVDGEQAVVAWVTSEGQAPWRKDVHSVNSTDSGATWGTSQVISAGTKSYAPKLAMSGSNVVVIWNDNDGNTTINTNRSTDGGATWDGVENIDNGAVDSKYSPQLAMSGSGVVAVWNQSTSGTARIWSNRSADGGATWSGALAVDTSNPWAAGDPYVALSGTNAVAVWNQFDGVDERAYSSYSGDEGITWSTPTLIQNDVEVRAFFVRVAASGPHAVAVWSQQESTVDVYSNHLLMLESPPQFLGAWGTQGDGDGKLYGPQGVSAAPDGAVYVSDTNNHRVQKFTTTGSYLTQWGSQGTGEGDLDFPVHLAAPTNDAVYVCDGDNDRVQYFDADGTYLGQFGTTGDMSEDGPGEFVWTMGIAIDSSFDVYVTDWGNHRVQKFDADGHFDEMWNSESFNGPFGLATDSDDDVYLTEFLAGRVQKYDGSDWSVLVSDADLSHPSGIAVGAAGRIYVCDTENHRIQVFDSDGNLVTRWGSYGTGLGQFRRPMGIAIHPNGDIYVADTDNHRIQVFSYNASSCTIELAVGWNLVSIPLLPVGDATPDILFGDAIVSIYEWNSEEGTYGEPDSIQYGKGYWVRSDTGEDVTVYGIAATVEDWQCKVSAGWTMLAAPSEAITVSQLWNADAEQPLVHSGVYAWNPEVPGYALLAGSDELTPGHAYWLACGTACTVTRVPVR